MTNREALESVKRTLENEKKFHGTEDWNIIIPALLTRYVVSIGEVLDDHEEDMALIKRMVISSLVCSFWCVVATLIIGARLLGWI